MHELAPVQIGEKSVQTPATQFCGTLEQAEAQCVGVAFGVHSAQAPL